MTTQYKLALIGFGNVGQGFTQILADRQQQLRERYGLDLSIVAICDPIKGSLAAADGLSARSLLDAIARDGDLSSVDADFHGWNARKTIDASGADILVELSYTDLKTGEPALSHIRHALESGLHVSTTNKGPVALHYPELCELARRNNACLGIEGTVLSGTPCLALGDLLQPAGIKTIRGILNGTTNFILGEMEKGSSFDEGLRKAQDLGYAEADPTNDVAGFDAAAKLVILANRFLGLPVTLGDVERISIDSISSEELARAPEARKRWKLIGSVAVTDNGYRASVRPELISRDDPLASVSGNANSVVFGTEILGDIALTGPGAGRLETGFAIIEDLLGIQRLTNQAEKQP